MQTLFEWYYLLAGPCLLAVGALAAFKRTWRLRLLVLAGALLAGWGWAFFSLDSRARILVGEPVFAVQALEKRLGPPDFSHTYAEGDADWIYAVRVWPWQEGIRLNVYGERVLAFSRIERIGLFYQPDFDARSPEAAGRVREFLAANSAPAPSK